MRRFYGWIWTKGSKRTTKSQVARRKKKEDNIDFSVGIVLEKKIGDKVENGDVLAYVHANDEKLGNEIAKDVLNAYTITNEIVSKKQDILKIV